MSGKSGLDVIGLFKNVYNNEFQWSVVKSLTLFGVGVFIAKECVGMEIMPAVLH